MIRNPSKVWGKCDTRSKLQALLQEGGACKRYNHNHAILLRLTRSAVTIFCLMGGSNRKISSSATGENGGRNEQARLSQKYFTIARRRQKRGFCQYWSRAPDGALLLAQCYCPTVRHVPKSIHSEVGILSVT